MSEDSQRDDASGRRIGPYLIGKRLGAGGMGEVYLASDTRLGRNVALKLLPDDFSHDRERVGRFKQEARAASALTHANVATIYEIGEADGSLYIAMEYIEGQTVAAKISGQQLDADEILDISLQVADALDEAHARSITHRDIKPANIIVTPRGQAKVLDFGLAKFKGASPQELSQMATAVQTTPGMVMGTVQYMSPEQALGKTVDQRSDIWSFGVVLYEMLAGRRPFSGNTPTEIIDNIRHEQPDAIARFNYGVSMELERIVRKCLEKDPERRYQSARELLVDLKNLKRDSSKAVSMAPASGLKSSLTLRSRLRPAIIAAACMLLVGVSSVAYFFWSRRAAESGPQTMSARQIKAIAVLPFRPLVADSRDESLELGMADTLIARLSNIREIHVRPISAVRKYVGLEQDAVAAGLEQKVDAVVDGQIQKAGEKVRVTVRLVRVGDGLQLWAGQFDEKMIDIFAVQDSISERVASALAVKLTGKEKGQLTKRDTENAEAYQLYLKGRYHLNRLTDDGFLKGRDYFQQAIDMDPDYALAYAGLSDAYNRLSGWNALSPSEGFPKARAAAMKALELDDELAEAHTQLGTVKFFNDWDWPGAETEFRRALEINPSYAEAHQMYSYYFSALGRFDEALAEMKRAQELDPISLEKIAGIGEVFYYQRRFDQAIEQYRKALEMDPNSGFTHWAIGNVYVQQGMYEEAIAKYQKAIPLSGDSADEPAMLAYAYALSGKKLDAQQVINELKERSKRRYVSPTHIGVIYAGLGEKDQAFAWLEKAYIGRDMVLVYLKSDPMFDRLRSDARFADLMRRVGLPQ